MSTTGKFPRIAVLPLIAAASLIAQGVTDPPIPATTIFGPAVMTGVSFPNVQGFGLATGDTNLYTVPAGKRVAIGSCNESNLSAGSITWYPEIKISATYYPLATAATLTTGTNGAATTSSGIILEAGEIFAINTTTTAGLNISCAAVQFDNTSTMKTVKLVGTSNGNNTIYTVPASKSAILLSVNSQSPFMIDGTGRVAFQSDAGGSRTIKLYYVASAGSPGATNQISVQTSPAASARFSFTSVSSLSTGMTVVMNVDTGAATQLMWVNVIEF